MSCVATIPRPASGISGNKIYRAFHAFEPFGVFMTITKPGVRLKETSLKVGISACFIFTLSEWPMCTDLREVTQFSPNHVKGSVRAEHMAYKGFTAHYHGCLLNFILGGLTWKSFCRQSHSKVWRKTRILWLLSSDHLTTNMSLFVGRASQRVALVDSCPPISNFSPKDHALVCS